MDISVGNPMDVGAEQPAKKAAGTGAVGRLILCEAFLLRLAQTLGYPKRLRW
jgi:hypothetical protein